MKGVVVKGVVVAGEAVAMASPTITSLETGLLRLPLTGTLRWGAGSELVELEHVMVRIEAEGGIEALAEAPVRPTIYGETVESIRAVVGGILAHRLIGRRLDDPALPAAIHSLPFNHAARGAVDLALHLARAQSQETTLAEQVGATRERAKVSFILGIDDEAAMVEEAERVVASGVRVLKVKVGRDPDGDERVLKALRHALAGEEITIYADANQAYRPDDALRRLEALAGLGVAYVEEPLPVHQLRERVRLRGASPLPIVADDSCFTLPELERELDFDTFDILNVKPARTGVSVSVAMMKRAAAAGKGVMIGSQASSGLGTLHAAVLALRPEVDHPCELSFPLKLERDSLHSPLRYMGGWLDAGEIEAARPAPFLHDRTLFTAELE